MRQAIFLFSFIIALQGLQVGDKAADKVDVAALNTLFETNYAGDIYSGYLNADKDGKAQFFYLFYPAIDEPYDKPVILWLQGGPGCSSLIGAFTENGPFTFIEGTNKFEANTYSWTSFANILYIESPVSVGYSFGPTGAQSDETTAAYNLYALVEFFARFPDFQAQKFYMSGESYAGIYVPTLASAIIDYNAAPSNPSVLNIKLQGVAIGNGCTHETECTPKAFIFPIHRLSFFGRHGFLSNTLFQQILKSSEECYGSIEEKCVKLNDEAFAQLRGVNKDSNYDIYNVYAACHTETPSGSLREQFNDDWDMPFCVDVVGLDYWLKKTEVRSLFHVKAESAEWADCKQLGYTMDPKGTYYLYPKLIQNNIRILKFSGDVDSVVPITGTLYWINLLQQELLLNTIKPWRPWYIDGARPDIDPQQVGGNVIDIEGLTFISVRNSGHEVAAEKKQEASQIIQKFINSEYWP